MISLSAAFEECRVLNRHYGTRFFHGLHLFPKELQPHIHGLCAFDRVLLEMIRNPREGIKQQDQIRAMLAWQKAFEQSLIKDNTQNPYVRAAVHSVKMLDVAPSHFSRLAQARISQARKTAYDNFTQLKRHLDAIAKVHTDILCEMAGISGTRSKKTIATIARAGELLELVIDTPKALEHDRLYFAKKDLKKFGCSKESLKERINSIAWQKLCESYVQTCEADLNRAEKTLHALPQHFIPAMQVVLNTYRHLIVDIRQKEYDLFTRQPKLGWKLKLQHSLPALGNLLR